MPWTVNTSCGCGMCPICQPLPSCVAQTFSGAVDSTLDQWFLSGSPVFTMFTLSMLNTLAASMVNAHNPLFPCLWGVTVPPPPPVIIPFGATYVDANGDTYTAFAGVTVDYFIEYGLSEFPGFVGMTANYTIRISGFINGPSGFLPGPPAIAMEYNVSIGSNVSIAGGATCSPIYIPLSSPMVLTVTGGPAKSFLVSGSTTTTALGSAC